MSTRPLIGITARTEPGPGHLPLYGIQQTYSHAIRRAGGLPVLLPPLFASGEAAEMVGRLDGLLLSGGGDIAAEQYGGEESAALELVDRERDRSELALVDAALRSGTPLLAICRGIQVLNVALGGTLYADILSQLPGALPHRPAAGQSDEASAHRVEVFPDSRLATILGVGELTVNSFHHQAARQVGEALQVTARAPDGVIEGLEHRTHPFCVGVQWHPEYEVGNCPGMERLFEALVRAAVAVGPQQADVRG